mgnify:CR=1 FL=1
MKKSIFGKIGAAAVVLTLVTSSLVGGTFAKYTSSASASGKVTAAKWTVNFTDDKDAAYTDSSEISLLGSGENETVIPGDSGEIAINIKGAGTEVGFDYTVKITNRTGDLEAVQFYTDSAHQNLIGTDGFTKHIAYAAGNEAMKANEVIYWAIPEETGAEGVEGKSCEFKLELTAVQKPDEKPVEGN